jgi:Uma2 family endonuclease
MELQTHQWTRLQYERLVDAEILGPEHRVELVGGAMVCKEPQHSPHATGIGLVQRALMAAFSDRWHVRVQMPIALDDDSEPEPDVAVVSGGLRDYRDAHPARAVLVVEVALSGLAFDRDHKGSLYARAALPEYWILNLRDRRLEIHRDPVPDAAAAFGARYGTVVTLGPDQHVSPLGAPDAALAVADLLP